MFGVCSTHSNLHELCAVEPFASDVEGAVYSLRHNGFVVVCGAFAHIVACEMRNEVCKPFEKAVREADGNGIGNRGPSRYSMAQMFMTGSCWQLRPFRHFLENDLLLDILDTVWDGEYQFLHASGDMALYTNEHQHLHSDFNASNPLDPALQDDAFHRRWPPPALLMSMVVHDINSDNGPLGLVPWGEIESWVQTAADTGRQASFTEAVPPNIQSQLEECPHWFHSRAFPLHTGDLLLRDPRLWHQGTPNFTTVARHMPSVTACSGPYMQADEEYCSWRPRLPCRIYDQLSDRAKPHCRQIKACLHSDCRSVVLGNVSQSCSQGHRVISADSSQLMQASIHEVGNVTTIFRCSNMGCKYNSHTSWDMPFCCGRCLRHYMDGSSDPISHGPQCERLLASEPSQTYCSWLSANIDIILLFFDPLREESRDAQIITEFGNRVTNSRVVLPKCRALLQSLFRFFASVPSSLKEAIPFYCKRRLQLQNSHSS